MHPVLASTAAAAQKRCVASMRGMRPHFHASALEFTARFHTASPALARRKPFANHANSVPDNTLVADPTRSDSIDDTNHDDDAFNNASSPTPTRIGRGRRSSASMTTAAKEQAINRSRQHLESVSEDILSTLYDGARRHRPWKDIETDPSTDSEAPQPRRRQHRLRRRPSWEVLDEDDEVFADIATVVDARGTHASTRDHKKTPNSTSSLAGTKTIRTSDRMEAIAALNRELDKIAQRGSTGSAADNQPADASHEMTLSEIEARRAAVMELYDARHEYVDQQPKHSDGTNASHVADSDTAASTATGTASGANEDWFLNKAHNMPVDLASPSSTTTKTSTPLKNVPRWLRGVETAELRKSGTQSTSTDLTDPTHFINLSFSRQLVHHAMTALTDERASNVVVIDIRDKCDHAEYMVIAEGRSSRQVYAMADALRRKLRGITLSSNTDTDSDTNDISKPKLNPTHVSNTGIGSRIFRDMSLPHNLSIQGTQTDDWLVLDLGSVMIHCFTRDARQFYDLEGMWVGMDPSGVDQEFRLEADEHRDKL